MTTAQALAWCEAQLGKALDYDGWYGAQCVDFFNYYVEYVTKHNPYVLGFGVNSAYQLYDAAPDAFFTKKKTGIPPPGSIMIYKSTMPGSGGHGHVAVVQKATATNITVYEQNYGGMYVKRNSRARSYELGYLIVKDLEANSMSDLVKNNVSAARIPLSEVMGRDFQAVHGDKKYDDVTLKSAKHGNKTMSEWLMYTWNHPEAVAFRSLRTKALSYYKKKAANDATIASLQKENAELKKQLGQPTQSESAIIGNAVIDVVKTHGYTKQ